MKKPKVLRFFRTHFGNTSDEDDKSPDSDQLLQTQQPSTPATPETEHLSASECPEIQDKSVVKVTKPEIEKLPCEILRRIAFYLPE